MIKIRIIIISIVIILIILLTTSAIYIKYISCESKENDLELTTSIPIDDNNEISTIEYVFKEKKD